MSQIVENWTSKLSSGRLAPNSAVLASALILVLMLTLPVAYWLQGVRGLIECSVASLLCLLPSLLALAVSHRFLGTPHAMGAILSGMALRSMPPLLVCLVLALKTTGLEKMHFVSYLLLFYMVALAVETFLSVTMLNRKQAH